MTFKRTFPYVITSALLLFGGTQSVSYGNKNSLINSNKKEPVDIKFKPYQPNNDNKTLTVSEDTLQKSTPVNAIAHKYDVVYTHADGNQLRRSGGTRAWRNNNPGCLRYSDFTVTQGAIGQAGGFAVFPDENTGMQAICALLKSNKYINLTISQAIFKYAPPHENDTNSYKMNLRKITGMPTTTKLSDLNEEQIMLVASAIKTVEGWKPGKETFIQTQVKDSLTQCKNIQHIIANKCYYEKTI